MTHQVGDPYFMFRVEQSPSRNRQWENSEKENEITGPVAMKQAGSQRNWAQRVGTGKDLLEEPKPKSRQLKLAQWILREKAWPPYKSLTQCDMPWVVFGDFNEITHLDEKLGCLDRDANHMLDFRDCISNCWLTNLGFVGQRYTWCNERLGAQRTLIRLDRAVVNEGWRALFPKAKVHHVLMKALDHCLLALSMKKMVPTKPTKRRFFFEAMSTRDESYKELIEMA